MSESMLQAPLFPGFRFYPTEEELVSFYLYHKLNGTRSDINHIIPVVDIYDNNPWDLPHLAGEVCGQDSEQWFFFIPRQEREARGGRINRLTNEGYWKATGSPGDIYSSRTNMVIGRKRTMVFYIGRAPNGTKTQWKMNEYKVVESYDHEVATSSSSPIPHEIFQLRKELSLCRLYKRSRSIRAFDRRPITDITARGGEQQPADRQHNRNQAIASLSYQQHHGHPMGAPPLEITDSWPGNETGISADSEAAWWPDLEPLSSLDL